MERGRGMSQIINQITEDRMKERETREGYVEEEWTDIQHTGRGLKSYDVFSARSNALERREDGTKIKLRYDRCRREKIEESMRE